MQIWRMQPDGSNQEQVTSDEFNNWFPHISPDGQWIAFISFPKDIDPNDHPYYKRVYLRLMPAAGGPAKVIAYVYGGQGTINVPSWSPDSRMVAFVSNTDVIKYDSLRGSCPLTCARHSSVPPARRCRHRLLRPQRESSGRQTTRTRGGR